MYDVHILGTLHYLFCVMRAGSSCAVLSGSLTRSSGVSDPISGGSLPSSPMASLASAGADSKGASAPSSSGGRTGPYKTPAGVSLQGPIPRPTCDADFDNEELFHSWFHVPGESWDVRVGTKLQIQRTKAPSAACMYTCVHCDAFTSNGGPGMDGVQTEEFPALPVEIAEILGVASSTAV